MADTSHASQRNVVLILAALCVPAAEAAAQAPLLDHQLASAVWIDAQRPTSSSGGPTSVLLLNPGLRLALKAGGTLSLVAEMPIMTASPPAIAVANSGGVIGGGSGTLPGNPYVGLRWTGGERWVDAGLRLPVARPDAASGNYPDSAGIYGDFDRHEAYVPDLASFSAGITQSSFAARGLGTRLNLSGNVDVPIRSRSGQRTDLYAKLSLFVGLLEPHVAVLAGVSVNARLNNTNNAYGEAVNEQLSLGVILRSRWVRPSLGIRIPLSSDLSSRTKTAVQAGLVLGIP